MASYTINVERVRVTIDDGPGAAQMAEAIAKAIAGERPSVPVEIFEAGARRRYARFIGETVETVRVRRR